MSKKYQPDHLLMASTSSVYGNNRAFLYVKRKNDTPIYFIHSKISNEAMGHSYSHLYNIPITMFRFLLFMGLGEDQICFI